MVGPLEAPITDKRWFNNSWVSPYFVIPKLTSEGRIKKWLLIHHLSFHVSGSRALSLNGHINSDQFPNLFPTPRSAAHLIFQESSPGSVLLGCDIKDFYRAFILSPYSWWKTYTFALGSFWFNPYLPFGGSSCT